jgi:predicted CxxxxCH...CXXCH cytochrome family protein
MAKSYACNVCHVTTAESATSLVAASKAVGGAHVNGQGDVDFVSSGGVLYNALSAGGFNVADNTCSNVYCHSDGKGNYATPDWDDAASGACGKCHSISPESGSHDAHIRATGANISCADCHGAGAKTGAHPEHVSGAIDYLAFEGSCNVCHTIETGDVALVWGNQATATCDACHGGVAATIYDDAAGVTRSAPTKPAYASAGHGKVQMNNVAVGCTGCHSTDTDTAHMNGTVGDTSRLAMVNGQTYATANPNAFCGACHDGGSGNEKAHYATTGVSDDGTKCNFCHDPHGVSGYDAMVRDTIQGRSVATFAAKALRASYGNPSFTGVCQVCHDPAAVRRFNRTTYSENHGGTRNCTECHPHGAETAFKPLCYTCHGGGTSVGEEKNYWPDGSTAVEENTAGKHALHMEKLSMAVYGEQYNTALLTTTDNGTADDKQRELCEFCHAAVLNDDDHMTGRAEVFVATLGGSSTRFAKPIWDKNATDSDAAYDAVNDTCSTTDCHNNKLTADGTYGWYDAGTSTCVMCHDGDADGASTGSHYAHRSITSYYAFACADCHEPAMAWSASTSGSVPSSGHLNGIKQVGIADDFTYDTNTLTCGTNRCHNNGKGESAVMSYSWGTAISGGCVECHGLYQETGSHTAHWDKDNNTVGMNSLFCEDCHELKTTSHIDRSVDFLTAMNYSGGIAVGDNSFGACTTTTCHQDGKDNAVPTPEWNQTAVSVGKTTCSLCHAAKPTTGSHNQHVVTGTTSYGQPGNSSTTTTYDFKCGECHGNTLANHIDGSASFGAVGWQGAGKTCNASYCHSNGAATPVYKASPAWGTGFAPNEDPCAGCHGNSPNTNAHAAHVVAIHWDSDVSKNRSGVYTGTTGLQGAANSDASAHGKVDTSTTINCNVCHNDTVTRWRNRQNTACFGCHENDVIAEKDAIIEDKSKHVNGEVNVKLLPIAMKTRAQIRNDITTVPELNVTWERFDAPGGLFGLFYKGPDDHDQARTIFNTATMYDGTTQTCTNISCHNGNQVKWSDNLSCDGCHTQLP